MTQLEIIRLEKTDDYTIGVVRFEGSIKGFTLELPYKDNKRNISSIPAGEYNSRIINSPKFSIVIKLFQVSGRSNILIHPGNTTDDTEGCILIGEKLGYIRKKRAVLNSKNTFRALLNDIGDQEFTVVISDHFI